MIVGGTINGEYIDIVLPQPKVEDFLVVQIKNKYKVSVFKAKAMLKSKDVREWQKEFEKEIKLKFAYYIETEITKWRNYDNYMRELKRRKEK